MSGLTKEQLAKRRHSIGGSDANIIMSGDQNAILNLWLQKTGQAEPEDLSWVQPVQFGIYTEPLNRRFYSNKTGNEITDVGREVACEGFDFLTCTLDGIVPSERAVFEAKCISAYSNVDEAVQKYAAQLHHNMRCTGLTRAVLSVFIGTLKYEHFVMEADPFYAATLLDAETAFWAHVKAGTPPGELPTIASPGQPKAMRRVDMGKSNSWVANAGAWRASKDIAKKFETATKELKALVEPDVSEAYGAGITCKRAKNGNLTISEIKL